MKKTTKKGFTLVELVIVIAIIAILAAVLIPTFSGVVEKANKSAAEQALRNAYTQALAEALASDGIIKTDDIVYIYTDGTVSEEDLTTGENAKTVEWKFTFTSAEGKSASVTRASDTTKYNYKVENGVAVVTAK